MRSCAGVVGRVEQVVEGRRLEITGVVVFHRLEVKVGGLGHATVATSEPVAQDGAGHVRAVPGVLVGGGAIADHVVIPHDSRAKITVVFVKTGIRHGHGLTRAIQVRGEIGGHGVRAHVPAGLVVESAEGRVGPKLHERRLTKQGGEVRRCQHPFVSAVVPCMRVVHDLTSHFAEALLKQDPRIVGQGDRFNGAGIVSPTVQADQGVLERSFTVRKKGKVQQVVVQEHGKGHGMTGGNSRVTFGLLEGQGRTLDHQPRG